MSTIAGVSDATKTESSVKPFLTKKGTPSSKPSSSKQPFSFIYEYDFLKITELQVRERGLPLLQIY